MSKSFQDHYFRRAKKENYLARSVYKLQEIQSKYTVIRRGNRVLDLGAAPGSWMQLAGRIIGSNGLLIGVDAKDIGSVFPPHVVFLQKDVFEPELERELLENYAPFHVILSDMAPSTSGVRVADSARSALLFERALELAQHTLKAQGHFLGKIFQGSEFHSLLQEVKRQFAWVKVVKPSATRKESKEIYILAMRFKKPL
jgi:23S rRNA (uridine2552-2'-O)-methyltransferase